MEKKINSEDLLPSEFFLSEVLGAKIIQADHKIGKLSDLVIVETGKLPEVTHLYVVRQFGKPALLLPIELVKTWGTKKIIIREFELTKYLFEFSDERVLLKDYILDKKVLDVEDREVEVVYDIKLLLVSGKLYVSEVDLSRYGLLRRIGLKALANSIYKSDSKIQDEIISWMYIQPLPHKLGRFKGDVKLKVLKEKISEMHPVDIADILEELEPAQRVTIFEGLDTEQASDTLEEIEPNVQRDLVISIKKEKAAQLINEMTPAQAADVLAVLPSYEREEIEKLLDEETFAKVTAIIEKQEESILNLSTESYLKFSPNETVGEVLDQYRKIAKDKDAIMYLYIVDTGDILLGVIDIKEMLQANDESLLKDIMTDNVISLDEESNLKEGSAMFTRYGLMAIPITNEANKILGVVTFRDMMRLKHRFVE
jgi:CBS domain-containing protein